MKKSIYLFSIVAFLASCDSDDKVSLNEIKISPSQTTLYYDSEAPAMAINLSPDNAENKVIEWSSSQPEVLDVDNAGKLTIKQFKYTTVKITASNAATGITATCDFVLAVKKADINDFAPINLKNELGFDVLDKNIGAKATGDAGYYFQFGNSIPVSTDGEILNKYYDKESNGGDVDWSKAENTPCPEGWRIPNMEEMTLLTDKAFADEFFMTDQTNEEYDAAIAFQEKLLLAKSGYFKIDGENKEERDSNEANLYKGTYFWSSDLNKSGKDETSARNFKNAYSFEYSSIVILGKKTEVNRAMPIRCIK